MNGVKEALSVIDCATVSTELSALGSLGIPVLPREYNAASYLIDRHLSEGRGEKVAFIDDRASYTYGELARRVNRAGNMLKSLGVEPEQRVMLCLLDGIDFAALFFGAIKIGAIPVPVNPVFTAADHEHLLRDSRARVAVVSASVVDHFRSIEPPGFRGVVVSGTAASELSAGCMSLDGLCAAVSDRLQAAETLTDEVAFWLYTTGSTGKPKAVVHPHAGLLYPGPVYAEGLIGMAESDVVFSSGKMCMAFGLGNGLISPLHFGATAVVMAERPTPEAVMEVMRRHQPTIFIGVPTLYSRILANPAFDRSKGSARLRICVAGGEAVPEKTFRLWEERFGIRLLNALGSTEALHIYLANFSNGVQYRSGTVGKPVPGYDVKILDERGAEVGTDEVGEVWVSGRLLSPGYWNNRAAAMKSFAGRWFRTGDLFRRDADGYFHFAGRADDMLRVGANWVSPTEVEACLVAHRDVAEAAVVGALDAEGLVKPKAFVVLRPSVEGTPELAEELKEFVKGRLALFKYPRWIEFCAELPRTAMGKIQRFRLRQGSTVQGNG